MSNFFQTIFLIPFLVTFLIAVIITPLSIVLIKRLGLLDDPNIHKHPAILHTRPIPRGGGIALFVSVCISSVLFLPLSRTVIALFFAGDVALLTGLFDDKYDISPYVRFASNIVVAIIVVASGVAIPFITNPLGGILHINMGTLPLFGQEINILSYVISILWIVWVMNMLNWSKGVDGQMPGIVTISALVIGVLSLRFALADPSTILSAKLSFIIAGAALGFLLFNFYPAKIFPGYGATSIYLLLSVVAILSGAKLATAILVMGVPMIDGIFTIFRRLLTGHSPFWHDKKHLHHLLLHLGLSQRMIAILYWCISGVLGSLALVLSSRGKLFAIIMLTVLLSGALLFLHKTLKSTHEKNSL